MSNAVKCTVCGSLTIPCKCQIFWQAPAVLAPVTEQPDDCAEIVRIKRSVYGAMCSEITSLRLRLSKYEDIASASEASRNTRAAPEREQIEAALANGAEILANFKGEKDRAKIEEWQACYAMLFKQLNDAVQEIHILKSLPERESGELEKLRAYYFAAENRFAMQSDLDHGEEVSKKIYYDVCDAFAKARAEASVAMGVTEGKSHG